MTDLNTSKKKKVNPKKQKRFTEVNIGFSKVPWKISRQKVRHEQLKDWETAS